MIKFCVEQWDKNRERLRAHLAERTDLGSCTYEDLVKAVVEYIFNDGEEPYWKAGWDHNKITEIDNGDYQGTLIYVIPSDTYQPNEGEYLMTFVDYGSCSGCDTLQHLQTGVGYDEKASDREVEQFMTLCRDIVSNTIKPYNYGWRNDPKYDVVEVKNDQI